MNKVRWRIVYHSCAFCRTLWYRGSVLWLTCPNAWSKIVITQDLYKAQLGATDVLSKVLLITSPYYSSPEGSSYQENEPIRLNGKESTASMPKTPGQLLMAVLEESLNRIIGTIVGRNKAHVTIAACLINVFIMAFQNATSFYNTSTTGATRLEPQDGLRQGVASMVWIRCVLSDLVAPRLGTALVGYLQEQHTMENEGIVALVQGCIQLLYTGIGALGLSGESMTGSHSMMNVAIKGLESEETEIAIAALKLLVVMIGATMIEPGRITQRDMAVIQRNLIRLQKSCEAQEVPSSELLGLLDKMRAVVS